MLMVETSFTDTIEEKLAFISPTVKPIKFGGDQATFKDFRRSSDSTWQALWSCLSEIPAWMPQRLICTRRQRLL
jgi:hypothetical protein